MLSIIQFPLADSRQFLPAGSTPPPLRVPSWPLPAPNSEFLRAFGPIKRRWRGGVSGWLGEGILCEADRALSFKGDDLFCEVGDEHSFDADRAQFWVAFRRFYADGLGLGKFEIGLVINTNYFWNPISEPQAAKLLEKLLNLAVTVPDPTAPGSRSCRLFEAGQPLSELYLWSSSILASYAADEVESWWVTPGEPLLYLTQDGWDEKLSLAGSETPIRIDGEEIGTLSHHLVDHHGRTFRLWNYREVNPPWGIETHRPAYYKSDGQVRARQLRLFLLRLHAEKQCLFQIIRHINHGLIRPARGSPAADMLQHYLNEALRRISHLRKHNAGLADIDVESLAKDFEETMTPGEYDSLLQALAALGIRHNVYFKTKKAFGHFVDHADLRRRLSQAFSLSDINVLCFDLEIDPDNLPALKDERIIGLIRHLENRGQLDKLITWLKENRAEIFS